MKKIDKQNHYAKEYETALAKFETNNHPDYKDSPFRTTYYDDVYYSLLIAQNGLCAYSESLILDDEYLEKIKNNFIKGKYNNVSIGKADGDIEHFNSELKKQNGWKWDNLFVVKVFINMRIKSINSVDDIFKPDNENYSPSKFFKYNSHKHEFVVNPEIIDEVQIEKINKAINYLGINSPSIISERRVFISNLNLNRIQNNDLEFNVNSFTKFPTACIDYFNIK